MARPQKVLIANRGEIALRIVHTCREMGIATLSLHQESDEASLHVRLADECVRLDSPDGFLDRTAILQIASERGVDAIHPGYGFLAEDPEFVRACEDAGLVFIGPPSAVVASVTRKLDALRRVRAAGLPTIETSGRSYGADELDALRDDAQRIGFPLVLKSESRGRGPGERVVHTAGQMEAALRDARGAAQLFQGAGRVYPEKEIVSAHQVGVQVLADRSGGVVHVEEREGSLLHRGQKTIEESPAPCLSPEGRARLFEAAIRIARLFGYENLGTIEFLVDAAGDFHFTEVKPRLQVEHPLSEMRARIDLVREQIRIAAGEALGYGQEDLQPRGWAMLCRVKAEDPQNHDLPSPGPLRVRLPLGPEVRVDTYVADHGFVPPEYDPLVAKVTVWAPDRDACLRRMRRALDDLWLPGGRTNLPLLQRLLAADGVEAGRYATGFPLPEEAGHAETYFRELAAGVAALHARQHGAVETAVPERLTSGWHRASRRLPE